jgi:hypothetical protein
MSISFHPCLLAMTVAASQCTVVITSGDLNSFAAFGFSSGVSVLTISGLESSGDFAHPRPCAGAFAGGRLVQTRIDLEPQGDGWIGRSVVPSDGIVVNLRTSGSANGRRTVSGTITGQAADNTPAGPTRIRIVFDPSSSPTLDGGGATIGQFASGNITGGATFIDATGASSKCDWVQWSLQPAPTG